MVDGRIEGMENIRSYVNLLQYSIEKSGRTEIVRVFHGPGLPVT